MKLFVLGGGLALGLGLMAVGATADSHTTVKGSPVTITGCVAGSDSDSFVLTHVQKVMGAAMPESDVVLGAHGIESAGEVIYWLSHDSVKKMQGHVGHRVEVTGTVTDLSTGTVKIKEEPGKPGPANEVEVAARGKDADAKTDRPVEPGPPPPPGTKVVKKENLPTYRIDVDTVRMISTVCP